MVGKFSTSQTNISIRGLRKAIIVEKEQSQAAIERDEEKGKNKTLLAKVWFISAVNTQVGIKRSEVSSSYRGPTWNALSSSPILSHNDLLNFGLQSSLLDGQVE